MKLYHHTGNIKAGLFILITQRPEKLLPTIRSRCQIVPFIRLKDNEVSHYNWGCRSKFYNLNLGTLVIDYAIKYIAKK